ncbi:MAG: exodeoxyribonuclease III [Candidatus Pacebacteria bacterium]|nr:exodeoxyribonuclease III [Candidatus Paceibacterota bacterium]
MKIISWNVNGIRACHKKGCWEWVKKISPDIICVQETKALSEQIPDEIKNQKEYISYFDSPKEKKGYSGVGILTKKEPCAVEIGIGSSSFDKEGRSLTVHFKDFSLINTYFPNGGGGAERFAFKLGYYDAFLKYIEKLRKKQKNLIFCGDVNTAHNEIDLARAKENEKSTGFLPEERAWIDKVVSKRYIDVFRYFYPETRDAYTYWDMKTFARERNIGWRLDYFFVTSELIKKVKRVKIEDTVLGSDHCPISLEINP